MGTLIAVAAGGAVGSLARYGLTIYCELLFGRDFPYGIFIANIVGSLAIGICFVLLLERDYLPDIWQPLVMVGFLGAFTTFSTFSLQALSLMQEGRLIASLVYVLGSVLLSLGAAWLGIVMTRQITT